jgi:hypothetical protein
MQINLLYTQLTKTSGELVWYPNTQLQQMAIVNISRSGPRWEGHTWLLDMDTPNEVCSRAGMAKVWLAILCVAYAVLFRIGLQQCYTKTMVSAAGQMFAGMSASSYCPPQHKLNESLHACRCWQLWVRPLLSM